MIEKTKKVLLTKMLNICLMLSGFFILCYCAGTQEIPDAKSLTAHVEFVRTIGEDVGLLSVRYSTSPAANFIVEKVKVGHVEFDDLPKKGEQLVGCGGTIFMVALDVGKKNIEFSDTKKELALTTEWRGSASEKMKDSFSLPSFAVKSISSEVSESDPLEITFAPEITNSEWDLCSIDFADGKHSVVFLRRVDVAEEKSIAKSEISLQQIKAAFGAQAATVPKMLKGKIVCSTDIKSKSNPEKSKLYYSLSTKQYDIKIN